MKICSYPFRHMYLDKFDGDVWLCPWSQKEYGLIGNIFETPLYEIWNGQRANEIRQAFREGKLMQMCRADACPSMQNGTLEDLTEESLERLAVFHEYPNKINLAHDYTCNQACETCRPHPFYPPADYRQKVEAINVAIAPFLDKTHTLSLSGHGDPFASPYMMDLMENLHPTSHNFRMHLETNGVYFDKRHWERIKHLSEFHIEVAITANTYDPYIYKLINKNGIYEKMMENLKFIAQLRKENLLKRFNINLVIQDKNFREMPSFIERSKEEFNCDLVVLRPVYQWGKTMTPDQYWYKDVLNPMHPYHEEYVELLDHPSMNKAYVYNFGGRSLHPATPFPGHFPKPESKYARK